MFDQFQLRSLSTSAKFLHPEVLKGAPEKRSFSSAGRSRIGRSRASSTGEEGGGRGPHLIGYHRQAGGRRLITLGPESWKKGWKKEHRPPLQEC